MRQIKFRCWYNGKVMMVRSLHNIHSQVNIRAELCDPDGGFGTNKPAVTDNVIVDTLMQFTGLTDRNGKEIYEGDILKDAGIVAWNDKREWHDMLYLTTPLEVIGNIYENPELLK